MPHGNNSWRNVTLVALNLYNSCFLHWNLNVTHLLPTTIFLLTCCRYLFVNCLWFLLIVLCVLACGIWHWTLVLAQLTLDSVNCASVYQFLKFICRSFCTTDGLPCNLQILSLIMQMIYLMRMTTDRFIVVPCYLVRKKMWMILKDEFKKDIVGLLMLSMMRRLRMLISKHFCLQLEIQSYGWSSVR